MAYSIPTLPVVGETITVVWGTAVKDSIENLGEIHNHSASGSTHHGTLAHSGMTGQTVDDHHDEDHASRHEPGGADAMAVDASAGTGSLRTLGTGAQQAAAGNHSHAVTLDGSQSTNRIANDTAFAYIACPAHPTFETQTLTRTPNDANSLICMFVCAWFENYTGGTNGNDNGNANLFLYADTTQVVSGFGPTIYPPGYTGINLSSLWRSLASATSGYSSSTDFSGRMNISAGPGSAVIRVIDASFTFEIQEVVY